MQLAVKKRQGREGHVPELGLDIWILAVLITVFAGFVKGAVGFAMPLIMVSGLTQLLDPRLAVAAIILAAGQGSVGVAGSISGGGACSAISRAAVVPGDGGAVRAVGHVRVRAHRQDHGSNDTRHGRAADQ